MKYRPNYLSLGLFTPRGPAASRTKDKAAAVVSETAMENEGGLVPKDPKASPEGTTQ
jgi:hypothetical protein